MKHHRSVYPERPADSELPRAWFLCVSEAAEVALIYTHLVTEPMVMVTQWHHPTPLRETPRIILQFYLEVHKIHQFRDFRLEDLHGFLINFHSIRLLVTFHLGINKYDLKRL